MKIGYFDCFAGAGGDMLVAAMLDAGLDGDFLKSQLSTLGVKGLKVEISETKRRGLRAVRFEPSAPEQGKERNLEEIKKLIRLSKISEKAKETAVRIFERIAEAEGVVHGKDPNDIHFHEIGAVDSIADIVSAAVGLEALGIERVYCSVLSIGGGTVKCRHGLMPVPAPATVELVKGVPVVAGPAEVELLTPTAAGILTTVAAEFGAVPAMKIEAVGCGAGSLDSDKFANIVRLMVGNSSAGESETADTVCLLETNIDDASGELVGAVCEKLLAAGALDAFTTAIYMKRNRPAVKLSVICDVGDTQKFEKMIFQEGSTFGIRRQVLQRSKLQRKFVTVSTEFGEIKIKVGAFDGEVVAVKPEFSDCEAAAKQHGVAVKAVLEAAMTAYGKQ